MSTFSLTRRRSDRDTGGLAGMTKAREIVPWVYGTCRRISGSRDPDYEVQRLQERRANHKIPQIRFAGLSLWFLANPTSRGGAIHLNVKVIGCLIGSLRNIVPMVWKCESPRGTVKRAAS